MQSKWTVACTLSLFDPRGIQVHWVPQGEKNCQREIASHLHLPFYWYPDSTEHSRPEKVGDAHLEIPMHPSSLPIT